MSPTNFTGWQAGQPPRGKASRHTGHSDTQRGESARESARLRLLSKGGCVGNVPEAEGRALWIKRRGVVSSQHSGCSNRVRRRTRRTASVSHGFPSSKRRERWSRGKRALRWRSGGWMWPVDLWSWAAGNAYEGSSISGSAHGRGPTTPVPTTSRAHDNGRPPQKDEGLDDEQQYRRSSKAAEQKLPGYSLPSYSSSDASLCLPSQNPSLGLPQVASIWHLTGLSNTYVLLFASPASPGTALFRRLFCQRDPFSHSPAAAPVCLHSQEKPQSPSVPVSQVCQRRVFNLSA
ncbi:hypothetical protein K491DRAFT_350048 [Lophiostoma macrostomum CBS 122681]|uniref:Uncharacterized protein n=1 Tax=Lophiostoma macrostomum CBS 122681 TaxID=1314788 RepID=A0A6A6TAU5_9PLEO|nr:hypothetical protein K491DRAFT_350048 [Lophiostoma macrostomum CBS 122681]